MTPTWASDGHRFVIRIEEIMTPRRMLRVVDDNAWGRAARIAEAERFEAIPILRRGAITRYWSRSEARVKPVTMRHRVQHDDSIERVLPRLAQQLVQFVCYRSEVVGLVDLSDLNRPLARLMMLRPILECEQAILQTCRALRLSDETIERIVDRGAVGNARRRQRRAGREDLDVPLLEFMEFPYVLKVGAALGLVSIDAAEVQRLTTIRNRSAHAGLVLVEQRDQGPELIWVLSKSREMQRAVRARMARRRNDPWPARGHP